MENFHLIKCHWEQGSLEVYLLSKFEKLLYYFLHLLCSSNLSKDCLDIVPYPFVKDVVLLPFEKCQLFV